MSDKYDLEAEALLPCIVGQWINPCRMGDHNPRCPHELRPAVAARLRLKAAEIADLGAALAERDRFIAQAQAEVERLNHANVALIDEIAALRSQLAELHKAEIERWKP